MRYLTNLKSLSIIALSVFAFNACDTANSGSSTTKKVAVTMQVQSSPKKMKTVSVDSLTEVKFMVEELELESIENDSLDFEVEHLIVNVPLDGTPFTLTSQQVPEGAYDEFEMEIENDGKNLTDPDFYEGDMRYSIVVKGIFNGEPFMYRSDEDFEIELDLNPPVEINDSTQTAAVAIHFDPASWFLDKNGNALNPNDPMNHEQITENIKNSFDAYGDNDHDDDDDDDDDD